MHHLTNREYLRKLIHILFGICFLVLIALTGTTTSTLIIGLCLIAGGLVSIALTRGHSFPYLTTIITAVERENEKHFPGKAAIYFFISTIILLVLFKDHQTLILAALSVQVFADAAAALVGTKYGAHKLLGKKTWEGTTAGFIVAVLCISYFYPLPVALISACIAMIVELLPVDDNLFVPLATAVVLRLISP